MASPAQPRGRVMSERGYTRCGRRPGTRLVTGRVRVAAEESWNVVPYYHMRVSHGFFKRDAEVDLTLQMLTLQVLDPYRRGRPITVAGKPIKPEDVGELKISETEHDSSHHRPLAQQNKRNSGDLLSKPLEWYVAELGDDVTDSFILGPPGRESSVVVTPGGGPLASPSDTATVFVVHGRNLTARDAMFAFLRSINLHPLDWSEAVQAAGKPLPYVDQVLDAAFSAAHAVIVLLTPDDEARLRDAFRAPVEPSHETELTGQARPNVLFEAGMAMSRSHERTVLVELGVLRPFSDIAGRHTIRIDNSSQRRQELAQRLQAAGCPVSLDGTEWHAAGDFDAAIEVVS